MPSPSQLLEHLAEIASAWRPLAVAWHVLLGGVLVAMIAGWRPTRRVAGVLLVPPLLSVGLLAFWSGNPFNGVVFTALSLTVLGLTARLSADRIVFTGRWLFGFGVALVLFGLIYPHFLDAQSWATYLYATPLGLIPCPTLAASIGWLLMTGDFRPPGRAGMLAAAGVFYGVIGTVILGVTLDLVLFAGAGLLAGASWSSVDRRVGKNPAGCERFPALIRRDAPVPPVCRDFQPAHGLPSSTAADDLRRSKGN